MRFNCKKAGIVKKLRIENDFKRISQWHRWFAWFPVEVAYNDCRWLEFVERKYQWSFGTFLNSHDSVNLKDYLYRAIEE